MNRTEGVTIMCNTHDLKIISASDRVVWIRDGLVDRIQSREDLEIEVGGLEDHK